MSTNAKLYEQIKIIEESWDGMRMRIVSLEQTNDGLIRCNNDQAGEILKLKKDLDRTQRTLDNERSVFRDRIKVLEKDKSELSGAITRYKDRTQFLQDELKKAQADVSPPSGFVYTSTYNAVSADRDKLRVALADERAKVARLDRRIVELLSENDNLKFQACSLRTSLYKLVEGIENHIKEMREGK